jgi:hypothetical protein
MSFSRARTVGNVVIVFICSDNMEEKKGGRCEVYRCYS